MSNYSKEFQDSIIQKSLVFGGKSLRQLAEENNIPVGTVYGWKAKYAKDPSMKNSKKLTAEQKLKAVAETLLLQGNELGEYIRKNGLHSSELKIWKEELLSGVKTVGRPKIDPEVSRLKNKEKDLQKDLRRKEKALAEMSARVILLKKSHEIFGDDEEDE